MKINIMIDDFSKDNKTKTIFSKVFTWYFTYLLNLRFQFDFNTNTQPKMI